MLYGDAVRECAYGLKRDLLVILEAVSHAGGFLCLHAVYLHLRFELLDRIGNTRNESAASDRHHDGVHIRQLVEYLQSYRSLAGDHVRIIKRVDESRARIIAKLAGVRVRIVIGSLYQTHLSAQSLCSLHLADRSSVRHADNALRTHACRSQSHALRVIARTAGYYAGSLLLITESAYFEISSSELEASGRLKILSLQIHLIVFAEVR